MRINSANVVLIGWVLLLTACSPGGLEHETEQRAFSAQVSHIDQGGASIANPTPSPAPAPEQGCFVSEESVLPANITVLSELTDHHELRLTDAASATEVIVPTGFPVALNTQVSVDTTLVGTRDGADIHLVYHNPFQTPHALGRINISGINFGSAVTAWDITQGTEPRTIRRGNVSQQLVTFGLLYPGDLYSPVMLMQNNRYTLGISLQYPVLEYKHHVKIFLVSGAGSSQWTVFADLDGEMAAGETREYVVSVRLLPVQEHMMKVLIPYRNYFHSLYGGVQYARDPRPVRGAVAAYTEYQTHDNPYGFSPTQPRPDRYGFGAWANALRSVTNGGYHRAMFWAPAGLYSAHPQANYPYQFMTHMLDEPMMAATLDELRSIPSENLAMGYWWGHAGTVISDWSDPAGVTMDPYNPELVRQGFAELDLAVDLGATLIGLDAISGMPDWDGYVWLQMMQQRAPGVFFIGELSISDILHTQAGSWLRGDTLTRENLLADFLLPGHESWASDGYGAMSPEQQAHLGYVPMMFSGRAVDSSLLAEPSWLRTIPPELRLCSQR